MNHEFVAAIFVALITGPGGWGTLQFFLSRKQKEIEARRVKEARDADQRRNKQAEDSQTWYRESRHHYEIAKEEAAEAKKECAVCRKELHDTRQVIYKLLEDLEDQILPMLMIPDLDSTGVRVAMRATIKTAREAL
jgi:uncharacterized protein HemX